MARRGSGGVVGCSDVSVQKRKQRKTIEQKNSCPSRRGTRNLRVNFGGSAKIGSVAKRCGHSSYTILNILAFDFSVSFVGYSLIGNISLTFFVAQRTKHPAQKVRYSVVGADRCVCPKSSTQQQGAHAGDAPT